MIDLYKDLIMDHALHPRNNYKLKNFSHKFKGFNHFCGDTFDLYVLKVNDFIKDISFLAEGCSISIASASLMTSYFKSKNLSDCFFTLNYFFSSIKNHHSSDKKFFELDTLSIVRKFPSRVKCATLIWHTFEDAFNK